jgi:protein-arginine kinase
VVRPESADFDTPRDIRRSTWEKQPVVNETHSRLRQHLGDEDQQLVCPKHLLPLKLVESRKKGGKLLDSYEYVCLAINADGSACDHNVTLQTMPQVAAMLQRTEGEGIIRN